jgi:hypothetical protein
MGLLQRLGTGTGYIKAATLGQAGSGKTFTSAKIAIGAHKYFGCSKPIAMVDSEGGSEYIAEEIRKGTGKDLIGVRTIAFDDLMSTVIECQREGIEILLVDSISAFWNELQAAHLAGVNRARARRNLAPRYSLEFSDWSPIKKKWAEWTHAYLNSRLHIIVTGRLGFTYEHETNEETRKKDLIKTGTKMKAEGEFAYEPSLLFEMERCTNKEGETSYVATILKDRFDTINGQEFVNPTFETFLPHFSRLKPGAHAPIDTAVKSEALVDEQGRDVSQRQRTVLLEEIQSEMLLRWPGQTVKDKTAKVEALAAVFDSKSWTAIEGYSPDRLRACLKALKEKYPHEPRPQGEQDAD